MKPLLTALVLAAAALSPAVASAQAAAVSAPAADPARVAAHEAALRAQIAGAQAGTLDYDAMTPTMAEGVRAQAAAVLPLFQQFGALQSVVHVGTENGAELFLVTFANVVTQWSISLDAAGKINGMLFGPAPTEDSGS